MSETKRVASPMANTMAVLDQGEEIVRSTSSLARRPLKKATSEGLISLSAEPGNVRFEVSNHKLLQSEGTRCSSAGRIERKLQLFKKKEDTEEQRRNSTDGIFFKPQPVNPLITKINAMTIGTTATVAKTKSLQDEKPTSRAESESSESESESDESESSDEETEQNAASNDEKAMEAKAEFLQCVMSGNYTKAQEICKQILLLEPDNATCKEFHSVIATKIEQDNMEDSDDDDDDDDSEGEDNGEDDDEEEEDDDNENEDDSNTSSSSEESEEDTDEEEFTITPGLNLLMGGLPIKPQAK